MGRRRGLSTTLVLGAIVLLIAIAIGNSMGNRVLGAVARRIPSFSTTPLPVTTPSGGPLEGAANLARRRRQVLSVATDPAFPDPRITPEPPPTPTPQPSGRPGGELPAAAPPLYPRRHHEVPTPLATPEPELTAPPRHHRSTYTSPPMLIPMPKNGTEEPSTPIVSPVPAASQAAVVRPTSTSSP